MSFLEEFRVFGDGSWHLGGARFNPGEYERAALAGPQDCLDIVLHEIADHGIEARLLFLIGPREVRADPAITV